MYDDILNYNKTGQPVQFAYERDYYLRIGAVATGSKDNTGKCYNFSPVFKMSSDFSKVEEVTKWDED